MICPCNTRLLDLCPVCYIHVWIMCVCVHGVYIYIYVCCVGVDGCGMHVYPCVCVCVGLDGCVELR